MLPERYTDIERIGHGGMGEIFRARDTALGRTVAVKLLAERYAADEAVRARFTREALAAARVSAAPNTVTIFDVGEWEGRPYIVMEHVPGGSLADRLSREGAQPPGRALAWLEDAARALDAAHAAGIVHRDVKPGNLLLDAEGNVKVADFGIASAAGLDSLTQAGTVLGTAGYLSPEQAAGAGTTAASDRYALGVVAYELLAGQRPFERDSPTAEAAAHVGTPPPPISSLGLPSGIDPILARALAKDPAERYVSCGAFVGDLRAALRADAGTTRIAAAPTPTAAAPAARGRRRTPWPLVVGLLVLLGLGGAGLAAALSDGDEPDPTAVPTTIERTVTGEGRTVTVTTTTEAEPPPTTAPDGDDGDGGDDETQTEAPPTEAPPTGDAAALNDEGFRLMQAGDYDAALPLLEQAVTAAQGSGTLTEAYASYNLAFTRFALGNCDGVLELLDRSQQVQGERREIDRLRRQAEKDC